MNHVSWIAVLLLAAAAWAQPADKDAPADQATLPAEAETAEAAEDEGGPRAEGAQAEPAEGKPAAQPAAKPDPAILQALRGAVDPYNPMTEKRRFFAAAGVDNELDAKEFEADRQRAKPFVRPFDKWKTAATFDTDGSGALSWPEADAYRRHVRKIILAEYDTNHTRRLEETERHAVARAFATGKVAAKNPDAPARLHARPGAQGGATDRPSWRDYDSDGDGKLSGKEREAYRRAARRSYELQRYDQDKDGQLDEEENARRERDNARRQRMRDLGRKRYQALIEKHDADGDGKLSREEQRAAWQARRQEMLEKYDADQDGKLSREESMAYARDVRAEWERQTYDVNGDGKLDEQEQADLREHRAEQQRRREAAQKRMAEYRKRMVEQHDVDGDGKLSRDEYRLAGLNRTATYLAKQEKSDKDGTAEQGGRAPRRRWRGGGERYRKRIRDALEKYDTDGDGQITGEEAEAYLADRRREREEKERAADQAE